jgi:WD40 repeat protein
MSGSGVYPESSPFLKTQESQDAEDQQGFEDQKEEARIIQSMQSHGKNISPVHTAIPKKLESLPLTKPVKNAPLETRPSSLVSATAPTNFPSRDIKPLKVNKFKSLNSPISALDWNLGLETYFACGTNDGHVRVLDEVSALDISTQSQSSRPVTSVAWSPIKFNLISSIFNKSIFVWEVDFVSNKINLKANILLNQGSFVAFSWHPKVDHLLACAEKNKGIFIWDFLKKEYKQKISFSNFKINNLVWGVFSENSVISSRYQKASTASSSGYSLLEVTKLENEETKKNHLPSQHVKQLAVNPLKRDEIAVLLEDSVKVWSYQQGFSSAQAIGLQKEEIIYVSAVAWSFQRQGILAVALGKKNKVFIYNVNEKKVVFAIDVNMKNNVQGIKSIAWHPKKEQLFIGCVDGTIQVADMEYKFRHFVWRNKDALATDSTMPDSPSSATAAACAAAASSTPSVARAALQPIITKNDLVEGALAGLKQIDEGLGRAAQPLAVNLFDSENENNVINFNNLQSLCLARVIPEKTKEAKEKLVGLFGEDKIYGSVENLNFSIELASCLVTFFGGYHLLSKKSFDAVEAFKKVLVEFLRAKKKEIAPELFIEHLERLALGLDAHQRDDYFEIALINGGRTILIHPDKEALKKVPNFFLEGVGEVKYLKQEDLDKIDSLKNLKSSCKFEKVESLFRGTFLDEKDRTIAVPLFDEFDIKKFPLNIIHLAALMSRTKKSLAGLQNEDEFIDFSLDLQNNYIRCGGKSIEPDVIKKTFSHKYKKIPLDLFNQLDERSIWFIGGCKVVEDISIKYENKKITFIVTINENLYKKINKEWGDQNKDRYIGILHVDFVFKNLIEMRNAEHGLWKFCSRLDVIKVEGSEICPDIKFYGQDGNEIKSLDLNWI